MAPRGRGSTFEAAEFLQELEDELSTALDSVLVAQADESLAELEDMLQSERQGSVCYRRGFEEADAARSEDAPVLRRTEA